MKLKLNLSGSSSELSTKILGNLTIFILPAISVILVIFAFFLIAPRVGDILVLSKSIKSLEGKVASVDQKLTVLASLDSNMLISQVAEADKALPREKDVPGLLATLDNLAQGTDVSITSFQIVPGLVTATGSAQATGVQSMPFKMSIAGSYEGVKSFLTKAVNSNRTLRIRSMAMSTKSQEEASVSAALDMETFYQEIERIKFRPSDKLPDITREEQDALEKASQRPNLSEVSKVRPPTGKFNPFQPF